MEFNEDNVEEKDEESVEIYSRRAIFGFSIFFATIFGGVLLVINLRKAGLKKAANTVLAFSLLYTIGSMFAVIAFSAKTGIIGYVLNILGGFILSRYFYDKYFPEEDYYPKPVWIPLGISIALTAAYLLIIYYSVGGQIFK